MHSEASQCLSTAEASSIPISTPSEDPESSALMFRVEEEQAQKSKHQLFTQQYTIHGVECRGYQLNIDKMIMLYYIWLSAKVTPCQMRQ